MVRIKSSVKAGGIIFCDKPWLVKIEDVRTKERQILIEYLKSKTETGDWHAVSDAANDLRVLEAQWRTSQ